MKFINLIERILAEQKDRIVKSIDSSDNFMLRMTFEYKNGYMMSLIYGPGSYGGDQELFEIAAKRPDHQFATMDIFGPDSDDVIGYLTEDEVLEHAKKIAAYKGKENG